MTTPLAILLVITAILLVWVAWPLFRKPTHKGETNVALQAERIASLKRALTNLKEQYQAGAIADDDYQRMERNTMLELAKVYEAAGLDPNQIAAEEDETIVEEADTGVPCQSCGFSLEDNFKFCPKCGAAQPVAESVA